MREFLYFILHTFTGCPEKHKKNFRNLKKICTKCGRIEFIFENWTKGV